MINTAKQLERLDRMRQALDYIVPAFRDVEAKGLRVELELKPGADGKYGEHIAIHLHNPAEPTDGAGLADVLGWTEAGKRRIGTSTHHHWFGPVGGFKARITVITWPEARDTQGRDPLPAGVGTGMTGRVEPVVAAAKPLPAGIGPGRANKPIRVKGEPESSMLAEPMPENSDQP